MAEEVWLGIDVGTQSVRCLAADRSGRVVASASASLVSSRSGHRHEQQPRSWWRALSSAAGEVMSRLGSTPVRAVALCATSGTVLLADRTGAPVTAGLMYDDARAVEQARRVAEAGEQLWESLGYRPQPSWALPKLLWLLEHEPPPAGAGLLHQADYLTGLLTGHRTAVDSSHALKTGYDAVRERWPQELLADLGVPQDLLPKVVRPGAALGVVGTAAATATGIPGGTPVVAGMTDGCASLLGSGALMVGSWNSVLGTTLVLKGVTATRLRDPLKVLYSHRAPDGNWLPGGAAGVGAGVLSAEFPGRDLDALSAEAAGRLPSGVVTYPLVARGERFPFVAADAQRFTIGSPRDDVERYAAVLRGVALAERLCFDYLDLLRAPVEGPVRLTGGGARSAYWCQLRADTLGRPVVVPEDADPAVGMALLARAGTGSLATAARDLARPERCFEPDFSHRAAIDDDYAVLIDELERRGWLPAELARHARGRNLT